VWFQPHNTASWAKNNRPLYGVLLILAIHVLVTLLLPIIDIGPAPATPPKVISDSHRIGIAIDTWVLPIVMLFALFWVGKYFNGSATWQNILWVLAWSQLPIIILSVLSVAMQYFGLDVTAPLLENEVSFDTGFPVFNPPIPEINPHGIIYMLVSTIPLLWSFQILLSGLSGVQSVGMGRIMWILTISMILLMLIRLPVTLALGDRDLLDVLGLKGIVTSG